MEETEVLLEEMLETCMVYRKQLEHAKGLVNEAYATYGIEPKLNLSSLSSNLVDYYRCLREFSRIMYEGHFKLREQKK